MTLSTPVPAGDEAPYTSVVGLLATFPDGSQLQFSGALVSPTEVLTAAHGVWQQGIGAALSVVAVAGGLPESDALAGTEAVFQSGVYAEDFHFNAVDDSDDSLTASATQQDYALVHFGTPLLGAAAFRLAQETLSAPAAIRIAGFPDGGPEVTATGTVAPAPGLAALTGDVALDDGSSGGPIWITSGGVPTIVGTVSTGGDAAAVSPSSVARINGWEALDASAAVGGDAVTPATGGELLTLTGARGVLTSLGRDTIQADAGAGVVYAAGPAVSVLGGSGSLVVVGGAGSDTVRPGTGSATLFGGSGGGILDAGRGGGSDVVAGSGASTLVGGGAGDALFCSPFAPTAATAGAGSEVIVGGGGPETLAGGSGSTVVFAGTGPDTVTAYEALGGTLLVVGFHAGLDTLALDTASGGRVATVGGGYGTGFTFANGARVVLFGVDTPPPALVS